MNLRHTAALALIGLVDAPLPLAAEGPAALPETPTLRWAQVAVHWSCEGQQIRRRIMTTNSLYAWIS